jgi:hypothetical protein
VIGGNFFLHETSPCAPANSPGACGLIGAFPPACVNAVLPTTWGAIKSRYSATRK